MRTILTFILNHCLFLFEHYGFKFADSSYSPSFGGDAEVIVVSTNIKLRFVFDRSQLLLQFASPQSKNPTWYSIDLISQIITGNVESSAVLNERYALFLVENFEKIIVLFSPEKIEDTHVILKRMAQERAKRLFG